jgi:hypothetical protein
MSVAVTTGGAGGNCVFSPPIDLQGSGSYDISYSVVQVDSVTVNVDNVFEHVLSVNADINKILNSFTFTDFDGENADVSASFSPEDGFAAVIQNALNSAVAKTTNPVDGLQSDDQGLPILDEDTISSFLRRAILHDISHEFVADGSSHDDIKINSFPGLLERVRSNYSFTLDTAGGSANAVTELEDAANNENLKSLFTQLPNTNIQAYLSGETEENESVKLPLVGGDTLVLVFDITVSAITTANNATVNTDITPTVGSSSNRAFNPHNAKSSSAVSHTVALKLKMQGTGVEAGAAFPE